MSRQKNSRTSIIGLDLMHFSVSEKNWFASAQGLTSILNWRMKLDFNIGKGLMMTIDSCLMLGCCSLGDLFVNQTKEKPFARVRDLKANALGLYQ